MKKDIKLNMLNIAFINKNYIKSDNGKVDYNYEHYLLDFVNNSRFVSDYGSYFWYNEKQSDAECDISNGEYDIDFKLLIPQQTIEKMNSHSDRVFIDKNGAVILSDSIDHDKCVLYNYLGIFDSLDIKDIIKIENGTINGEVDKIVNRALRILKTNKNTAFYLPVKIIIPKGERDSNYLKYVAKKIYKYLESMLYYRCQKTKKDTFICFVIENMFVFLKLIDDKLIIYDEVPINKSDLFVEIISMTSPWQDNSLE